MNLFHLLQQKTTNFFRPTFSEIDKTLSHILTSSPPIVQQQQQQQSFTPPPVAKVTIKTTDPSKTQLKFPTQLSLKINETFPCSFITFDTENSPRDQGEKFQGKFQCEKVGIW